MFLDINFLINDSMFNFILVRVAMFSLWFIIGYYFYNNSIIFKKFVDNTTLYECYLISILTILLLLFILNLSFHIFNDFIFSNSGFFDLNFTGESSGSGDNTTTNTSNTNNSTDSKYTGTQSDGVIMTAGLVSGLHAAKNSPSFAGKAAAVAGGIGLGASAIVAKNIAGNMSSNIGKKNFIDSSEKVIEILKSYYNLSGNDALDLLYMIQVFNYIKISLIITMFYILFCLWSNESSIKEFLLKIKIIPLFIINYYIKIYNRVKNISFILLVILLLLNLISSFLSYYYLGFFIENVDEIIKIYFK